MRRLNICCSVAIAILYFVLATSSEANVLPGEQENGSPLRSTDQRYPSTQLLEPDDEVKRDFSNSLKLDPRKLRVSRERHHTPSRPTLGSTSTPLSELGIEEHSSSAYPSHSLSTRSQFGLNPSATINMTLQAFSAVIDPTGKAISEFIDFHSKVIYAAANYYASFAPVQKIQIAYGRLRLRLMTTPGDTIPWIIVKSIGEFALEFIKGGFYGLYFFIFFTPIYIAVRLGFVPRPETFPNFIG